MAAPKLNPAVAGWAGVVGLCCAATPLKEKVGAGAGSVPAVWVAEPKVGAAGAAEGVVVLPNAKPVELAPNPGFVGVPKVEAAVVEAPPKAKGAGAGAAPTTLPPKEKGLVAGTGAA